MKLKIINLTKKIRDKTILQNVNVVFESGKYYGFLGNNGAGKTTLLKCIFNEYIYQSGEIFIDDKKMTEKDLSKMYYFSDNTDLPKNLSIYDFLQTQYLFNKKTLNGFKEKVTEKNIYFKEKNIKKTIISSLSSGQQKLVSLLACNILDPKIIFFDEPTTNLDISNKQLILNEIKKIDISDKIVVVITHLVDEVKDLLDEIVILNQWSIVYKNSTKGINIREKFLEVVDYKEGI